MVNFKMKNQTQNEEFLKFCEYEMVNCWWTGLIFWRWGQKLAGNYFAKKTKKKYDKYQEYLALKSFLDEEIN